MNTKESIEATLARHSLAVGNRDDDAIKADYTDDCVFLTTHGALQGPDEVVKAFEQFAVDLPSPDFTVTRQIIEGDYVFVQWTCVAGRDGELSVDDGVDTFHFRDGKIAGQSVRYTVKRAGLFRR